jgi:flagellar hook-basal body complex protein FliE
MIVTPNLNPAIGADTVRSLERTLANSHGANSDFSSFLENAIDSVNRRQIEADAQLLNVATGKNVDIHGQMIALEEASISLRTMASARDKIVEAYNTIWNMQI